MKNVKFLIGILVGVILSIGISNAYNLNASEVTYDKKTTTLESNTVSGAIDELGVLATTSMSEVKSKLDNIEELIIDIHDNIGNLSGSSDKKTIINLGAGTQFDVTKYGNYENFTVDNFLVGLSSISVGIGMWSPNSVNSVNVSKSYNASTGILTISNTTVTNNVDYDHGSFTDHWASSATATPNVWLVY